MPVVNPLARELVFKVVYYGPGLGGKTTTLQHIHATTKPEFRGKIVSLATPVDRTLYFDFLPIRVPSVRGMGVRLQLFTVPGQVYYNATRKLVLTGADGVVLVVDSQRHRGDANLESLDNLIDNVREHGRSLEDVPHVIQFNKRDLPDVVSVAELEERLNRFGCPAFGTVATRGDGVYESLEAITRLVLDDFEQRIPQSAEAGGTLELPEGGLTEALKRANGSGDEPHALVTNANASDLPSRAPPGPDVMHGENAARAVMDSRPSPPADKKGSTRPEARRFPTHRPHASRSAPPAPSAYPSASAEAAAPAEPGWSFEALWPVGERPTVRQIEHAIAAADYGQAVELSEQLVARAFAGAANIIGSTTDARRDPAVIPLLLGLDGRRYLEFRGVVRDGRAGRSIGLVEALEAYAFAVEARLARSRVGA